MSPTQRKKVTINEDVVEHHTYDNDAPIGGASVDSLQAIYEEDNILDACDSDEDSDMSRHSFTSKCKRIRLNVAGRKKINHRKQAISKMTGYGRMEIRSDPTLRLTTTLLFRTKIVTNP